LCIKEIRKTLIIASFGNRINYDLSLEDQIGDPTLKRIMVAEADAVGEQDILEAFETVGLHSRDNLNNAQLPRLIQIFLRHD
jgi:hypothetical protein